MSKLRLGHLGADGVLTLLLSCLLIICTLGLSWAIAFMRVYLMASRTTTQVKPHDWILVLGKRLLGATVTLEYATRLSRAENIYKADDCSRIMILGGYTSEGPFSEARQGLNYLLQRGLPAADIYTEDRSRHTLENLRNARDLMDGSVEKPLTLITSRYHLARSHALAAGFGLPHQLCAAEERLEPAVPLFWKMCVEAFFLHWYWVGRYWSLLTRNHKSLARIS